VRRLPLAIAQQDLRAVHFEAAMLHLQGRHMDTSVSRGN
jgi:hypothetical protein